METIGACTVICNLKTFRWLGKKKKSKNKQTNKNNSENLPFLLFLETPKAVSCIAGVSLLEALESTRNV